MQTTNKRKEPNRPAGHAYAAVPERRMSDLDKFNYECEGQISLFENEESTMDKITTKMAEHICDKLCRFPREMEQEELDEHCCDCKLGEFICDILNTYNRINDFEQTQCHKLMQKVAELEKQLGLEVQHD